MVIQRTKNNKWWQEHGFEWELTKRFVSKSVYEITKDEITMEYEIPNVKLDIKKNIWIISKDNGKHIKSCKN